MPYASAGWAFPPWRASKRALTGARANQNVLALNRAEFRIARDPRPEQVVEGRQAIEEQLKTFEERLENLGQTRDDQARAMLPAVKAALAEYKTAMEETLRLASLAKEVHMDEQTLRLHDAAAKSMAAAERLQTAVRLVLPGELAKHAVSEGTKAVTKFTSA